MGKAYADTICPKHQVTRDPSAILEGYCCLFRINVDDAASRLQVRGSARAC